MVSYYFQFGNFNEGIIMKVKSSVKKICDNCKVIRITNKRNFIQYNYKMHNNSLEVVKEEKYLGVVINQKLS